LSVEINAKNVPGLEGKSNRVTRLGDFFAYWAIVYFVLPKFLGYFLDGKSDALILTNSWLGYILGHFITNSSFHPESHAAMSTTKRMKVCTIEFQVHNSIGQLVSCDNYLRKFITIGRVTE
jgi:hypothetical protein